MSATDLVNHLRAEVERLRARIQLLEHVARLNGKTVRYVPREDDATPGPCRVSTPLLAGQRLLFQQVQASYQSPYPPLDQVEAAVYGRLVVARLGTEQSPRSHIPSAVTIGTGLSRTARLRDKHGYKGYSVALGRGTRGRA